MIGPGAKFIITRGDGTFVDDSHGDPYELTRLLAGIGEIIDGECA